MADEEEIGMLREDINGELEAINQYQEHIDEISNPDIKRLLTHIIEDEKGHVAELIKLLTKFDQTQAEKLKKEGL